MNTPYAILARRQSNCRTLRPGEFIFQQGDEVTVMYLVRCGVVRVGRLSYEGDEVTLALARGAECFGAIEVLLDLPTREGFAQATVESIIQPLFLRDLSEPDRAELRRNALAATYRAQICLAEMLPRSPARRLTILLRHLAAKTRVIRLSQEELGQAIGCPPETVGRVLCNLEESGAVSLGRRAIEILDRDSFAD